MKNEKRAPLVAASKGSKNNLYPVRIVPLYCITGLLALTTIIAGWHIVDVWSGIVTMLCGTLTVWLVNTLIGGMEDE